MDRVFGYSYVGGNFREVVRLSSETLTFKSKRIVLWSDIVAYRAFPDFYADLVFAALKSAKPRITLYLRDGRILPIRGDILTADFDTGGGTAFAALLRELREHGVPKWTGPKEETTLYVVAFTLFALGVLLGYVLAQFWPLTPTTRVGIGVLVGVTLGQVSFLIAPLIARRLRRLYISATQDESSSSAGGGVPP